jgi:SAM-dependent methyltransferase
LKKQLNWPPLPDGRVPLWDGSCFRVGGNIVPYLAYSENLAGWDDSLTSLHKREEAGRHPIEVTSRSNAIAAIRRLHRGEPSAILEVGSAHGLLLEVLKTEFPDALVVGSEVGAGALAALATERLSTPLLQLDILKCPLPAESFDVVVALNVLEHIEDDTGAVQAMARLLSPGGILIVEVPAGPNLYDAYDEQLHHFRRYTMMQLERMVASAGLSTVKKTHIGFFVYPMFAAVKKLNRMRAKSLSGRDVVSDSIRASHDQGLLGKLFGLERALLMRTSWPFGIRCFLVARKAGTENAFSNPERRM